jgi:putative transposase
VPLKREVLGVSVSLSEAEVHWRHFFEDLQKRGMNGLELLISDDHSGLGAARKAMFPSVPWQRYQLNQGSRALVTTRAGRSTASLPEYLGSN